MAEGGEFDYDDWFDHYKDYDDDTTMTKKSTEHVLFSLPRRQPLTTAESNMKCIR